MVLARDKRTSRSILLTEGYLTYKRYRLYAVNTQEHPDSVARCMTYYGSTSVYPLDIYLGIDQLPFKISVDCALRIAKIGAESSSYDAAARRLLDDFEWKISADEIREITDYIGEIILKKDQELTQEAMRDYDYRKFRCQKPGRRPKNGYVLYCEMDGAMFNTRRPISDSNDETAHKNKKESSSWKENKLGIVFRSDELINTGKFDEQGKPIMRLGRREYICTTEGVDTFRERLLWTMLKNGMEDASDVVFISDGAVWIAKTRETYVPGATRILDLFHLKENVMKFAQYIHANKPEKYTPWWKEVCKDLEDGKWKDVLNRSEILEYKEKDTPRGIVNLYQYIENNREAINYPLYAKKGYFVGSGAIESGNKTVLQERLKLSGMRWLLENAETLLALRAKLKSNLWETEIVPLIRKEYSKWHLNPDSIRQKQRIIHKKKN